VQNVNKKSAPGWRKPKSLPVLGWEIRQIEVGNREGIL